MSRRRSPVRCRVCLAQTELNDRGVCIGCERAKLATDTGTSYGRVVAVDYESEQVAEARRRKQEELEARIRARQQKCCVCGTLFFNPWKRPRKTCSSACADIAREQHSKYGRCADYDAAGERY